MTHSSSAYVKRSNMPQSTFFLLAILRDAPKRRSKKLTSAWNSERSATRHKKNKHTELVRVLVIKVLLFSRHGSLGLSAPDQRRSDFSASKVEINARLLQTRFDALKALRREKALFDISHPATRFANDSSIKLSFHLFVAVSKTIRMSWTFIATES